MKTFMLLQEVVHIPTKKKATVISTKLDNKGDQLIEIKYENGVTGWATPANLTTFIQDNVEHIEHEGRFLAE